MCRFHACRGITEVVWLRASWRWWFGVSSCDVSCVGGAQRGGARLGAELLGVLGSVGSAALRVLCVVCVAQTANQRKVPARS